MIKKWLSTYRIGYPRAIVYMLQANEYKLGAYLKWQRDIKSFQGVEVRKKLVLTKKAILLYIIACFLLIATYSLALYILFLDLGSIKYLLFGALIIISPYILAYGIVLPLFLIKIFVQMPAQYFIIKSAREKLKRHKAIKIAIAGSYGKTSMREILKTVLMEGKKVAAPPENHNTLLGISRFIKNLTGDEEILIFELGEYYQGDIKEMCRLINPDIGIITGVNEAHLEKFKNLNTTASTIFELSDWLGNKPIYVNGENKLAKEKALPNHKIYSRSGLLNWQVGPSSTDLSGTTFAVTKNNTDVQFKTNLLGLHQIGPLVLAIHLADSFGMSIDEIKEGVRKTKPYDHRLNPATDPSGVTILDDSYNGNPDGVRAVTEFLASLKGRRRLYITPGLVEIGPKTEAVHKEIGRNLAKAGIEKVVLIKNSVTQYIEAGLKEANFEGEIVWFDDSLKMLQALPHLTIAGDVVLLQNDWPDQYY